jgi:hypothetical protein
MKLFDGTLRVETIKGRRGPFNVGTLTTDIGVFKVKDKELDQFDPGDYSGNFQVEKIFTASNPWRGGYFTEIVAQIAEGGFLIDQEDAPSNLSGEAQAEPDPLDVEHAGQPASVAPAKPAGAAARPRPSDGKVPHRQKMHVDPMVEALIELQSHVRAGVEFPDACSMTLKRHSVDVDALRAAYDASQQPQPEKPPETDSVDLQLFGVEIHPLYVNGEDIALDPTVDREQFRRQRDRLKESGYRFHAQSQVWRRQATE